MTRKLGMTAVMVCAGLFVSATSASAQEWLNPGRWFGPAYGGYGTGYRSGYGARYAPASGGSGCRDGGGAAYRTGYGQRVGYGDGACSSGSCGCRHGRCDTGSYGTRGLWEGSAMPGYRSYPPADDFTPYPTPGYGSSSSRGPTSSRPRYNPFYE